MLLMRYSKRMLYSCLQKLDLYASKHHHCLKELQRRSRKEERRQPRSDFHSFVHWSIRILVFVLFCSSFSIKEMRVGIVMGLQFIISSFGHFQIPPFDTHLIWVIKIFLGVRFWMVRCLSCQFEIIWMGVLMGHWSNHRPSNFPPSFLLFGPHWALSCCGYVSWVFNYSPNWVVISIVLAISVCVWCQLFMNTHLLSDVNCFVVYVCMWTLRVSVMQNEPLI